MLRHIVLTLCVGIVCIWSMTVHAGQAANGYLTSFDGKDFIFDFELAGMIDDSFEDGSKGDDTINSNIVIFFLQCYGGDWHDNFNMTTGEPEGGSIMDHYTFTRTVTLSATERGNSSYYGGYHDNAASALKPGATVAEVHQAGLDGRRVFPALGTEEKPERQNFTPTNIGGNSSTHVVVWAGNPEAKDREDITKIANAFPESLTQTVTILAGDGSTEQGTNSVNGAATQENLKATLEIIGDLMDDGPDEQFILFVTDHGGITHFEDIPVTAPASTFGGGTTTIKLPVGTLEGMASSASDVFFKPSVLLYTSDEPGVDFAPNQVGVDYQIDGGDTIFLSLLDEFTLGTALLPDGTTQNTFNFPLDPFHVNEMLDDFRLTRTPIDLTVNISNFNLSDITFSSVAFNSGSVSKLPEPSTLGLLVLGGLFWGFSGKSRLPQSGRSWLR